MAVTANPPGNLPLLMWQALLGSNDLKVMLLDADTWSYDKDSSIYISEVTGEVSGTGYTAGGQILSNPSATYDEETNSLVVDADDPFWNAAGGKLTAARAVFFVDTGTGTASPIVTVWDFNGAITATNAPFTLTIDKQGLLRNSD
jgi:hypothetical protein